MATESRPLFNPCDSPSTQRLPAKIWELLRRNDAFRNEVERLQKLDKQAAQETEAYHRAATQHNQALAGSDNARMTATQKRLDQIKHRPIRSKARGLIEKHTRTHPLAALALTWLVPEPAFHDLRKKNGQIEYGEGASPDYNDGSWRWERPNDGPKGAVGHHFSRGPNISARNPDWKNWRRGEALFSLTTAWNRLPKSFKRSFVSVWKEHYDFQSAYEFTYIHPPRKTDNWDRADFAKYLAFTETVSRHRLFAVSPTALTTKDVGAVFEKLREQVMANLPKNREHLFGSEAAWRHYLARSERGLSMAEHIAGPDWKAKESDQLTAQVRNQRKNVQYGVNAVKKLISLVFPSFDLKKAALVHSAPLRKKRRKPRSQIALATPLR